MFAVIKSGGKQYKVAPSDLIEVATVAGDTGDVVTFEEVLLHGGDTGTVLGSPLVSGASVAAEIVGQKRGARILVFKKRRRQNSKRSRGHRQDFTLVRITEILTDGRKPEKKAKAPVTETPAIASGEEAPAAARKPRAKKTEATTGAASDTAKPVRKPRAKSAKSEDKSE
jgi:large subunit ribosomal protein L21